MEKIIRIFEESTEEDTDSSDLTLYGGSRIVKPLKEAEILSAAALEARTIKGSFKLWFSQWDVVAAAIALFAGVFFCCQF